MGTVAILAQGSKGRRSDPMVRVDTLRDCLNQMVNAEKAGKRQVLVRPASKVVVKFLQVMQKQGYIGEFEIVDDHRGGKIAIDLIGRINKCGVISPRFNVTLDKIVQLQSDLLPSASSATSSSPRRTD